MARLDAATSPDVAPETSAPDDAQRIQAGPAAFGAAVGTGLEQAGAGALDASKFYSTVAAQNGTNNTLEQVNNILHGDPNKTAIGPDGKPVPDTGFFGLRGADAMSARQSTSQAIDQVIQKNRENLSTPEAQVAYDNETRNQRAKWLAQMGTYSDEQQHIWATDTNNTTATIGLNSVSRVAADDTASAAAGEQVRTGFVRNAQLSGEDPQGALLKADQQIALTRIRTLSADPATAKDAQRVLDQSRGVLGSLPGYDGIVRQVKGAVIDATMTPAVDAAVNEAVTQAARSVGTAQGAPTPDMSAVPFAEAKARIIAHEAPASVGGYNAQAYNTAGGGNATGLQQQNLTGMTIGQVVDYQNNVMRPATAGKRGANDVGSTGVGAYQFESGTLQQQAKSLFGDKWRDMTFSPQTQDLLAEHLYNQVRGNPSQLGNTWAAFASKQGQYPSTVDALNANMSNILDKAQVDAERLFPGYPDAQDRYVSNVTRRLNQTMAQETRQYEVDSHVVQGVLAGDNPPISEQELISRGPAVASAWRSMQVNNPMGAMSVERMFDANAKGRAVGNGAEFKDYLDRTLAPSSDPGRLSNPSQVWPYVGEGGDAPLTNTGANALTGLMALRGTPQGEAQAAQIKAFVDQVHGQLSYSNKSAGLVDPKGEAAFGKFMSATLPTILNGAKGGNLDSLLNPQSKDYLGNAAQTLVRTPAQIVSDRLHGEGVRFNGTDNPTTLAGLRMAVAERKVSPDEAAWIANRMGFQKAPAVPHAATPAPNAVPLVSH